MDEPSETALFAQLGRLPAPAIDPSLRDWTLRAARGELRRPGEGTLSLRGLGLAWETALAPALVLFGGIAHAAIAAQALARIFAG